MISAKKKDLGSTFKKIYKLKGRKKIALLFQKGIKLHVHPFKVLYIIESKNVDDLEPCFQWGIAVMKRNIKKAVHRNRIKRLFFEAFRFHKNEINAFLQQHQLHLTIFFIYLDKEENNLLYYQQKVKEILTLLYEKISLLDK